LDIGAKLTSVERTSNHRSAALRATGGFGVIVGKDHGHIETHRSLLGKEIDRFRSVLDERVDASAIKAVACFVSQIGATELGVCPNAPCPRERRAWYP